MPKTIRAKFTGGALEPLERLDLEEGAEVTVSVEDSLPSDEVIRALRATAGAWKGKHDPDELKRMLEVRLTGSREELYARAEIGRNLESAYGSVKPPATPEDSDQISRNAKDAKVEGTLRELRDATVLSYAESPSYSRFRGRTP